MNPIIQSKHIPFAMPTRKHSLIQEWKYLTFMHWEVSPKILSKYIPKDMELDLFEGKAYIGLIPFLMKDVHPRLLFPIGGISNFPEFNIRTYVKLNNKPGVFFLTLDAQSYITCLYAPYAYGLPYNYSKGNIKVDNKKYIWKSNRRRKGFELSGFSILESEAMIPSKGSLEEFLFERYCLFSLRNNKICIGYIKHNPWNIHRAHAKLQTNKLTKSFDLGIKNLLMPELVHMSKGVTVNAWSLQTIK